MATAEMKSPSSNNRTFEQENLTGPHTNNVQEMSLGSYIENGKVGVETLKKSIASTHLTSVLPRRNLCDDGIYTIHITPSPVLRPDWKTLT
jgi:hypothetical protein